MRSPVLAEASPSSLRQVTVLALRMARGLGSNTLIQTYLLSLSSAPSTAVCRSSSASFFCFVFFITNYTFLSSHYRLLSHPLTTAIPSGCGFQHANGRHDYVKTDSYSHFLYFVLTYFLLKQEGGVGTR